VNGIGWFQISVQDAAKAERFYGDLFGWTFGSDLDAETHYRIITTPDERSVKGGLAHGAQTSNHAIFCVVVQDVEGVCDRVLEAGGSVLNKPMTTKTGLVFAHILDPEGNHIQIFRPAAS
jgi:predicted enzyme related to lactoylglutathione lyase